MAADKSVYPPIPSETPSSTYTPVYQQPLPNSNPMQPNGPLFVPGSSEPMQTTCNHCGSQIRTSVDDSPSLASWIGVLSIAALGFICGCCFIPLCMDKCKVYNHKCPNCNVLLGKHKGEWAFV